VALSMLLNAKIGEMGNLPRKIVKAAFGVAGLVAENVPYGGSVPGADFDRVPTYFQWFTANLLRLVCPAITGKSGHLTCSWPWIQLRLTRRTRLTGGCWRESQIRGLYTDSNRYIRIVCHR
jgi:hypothetical protein